MAGSSPTQARQRNTPCPTRTQRASIFQPNGTLQPTLTPEVGGYDPCAEPSLTPSGTGASSKLSAPPPPATNIVTAGIGVYRPSTSHFYLRYQANAGNADLDIHFGNPYDVPVIGDWNGDGVDTIGVYRPTTGNWYLRDSNAPNYASVDYQFTFGGSPGDQPITGDWDGDGKYGVALFRPTTRQVFFIESVDKHGVVVADYWTRLSYPVPVPGDRAVGLAWDPSHNLQLAIVGRGQYGRDTWYTFRNLAWFDDTTPYSTHQLVDGQPVVGRWVQWPYPEWSPKSLGMDSNSFFALNWTGCESGIPPYQCSIDSQFQFGLSTDLPVAGRWAYWQDQCAVFLRAARYGFMFDARTALLEQLSPYYTPSPPSSAPTPMSVAPAYYKFFPQGFILHVDQRYNEIAVRVRYYYMAGSAMYYEHYWIDSGFLVEVAAGSRCDATTLPQPTLTPTFQPTRGSVNDVIVELVTYGIRAYASGLPPAGAGSNNPQAWSYDEIKGVLDATQKTAAALNLLRNGDQSGSNTTAKALFRKVMVSPNAELQIWHTSGGFTSGSCDHVQDQACTDNVNARIGLDGAFNGATAPEYTVVHEFGHRFNNQSAIGMPTNSLFYRMGGGALPVVVYECSNDRVFGLVAGQWERGARGWGSGPGRSEYQQNVTNQSGVTGPEVDEAVADMFLNWVYRKVTEPSDLYTRLKTITPTPGVTHIATLACAAPAPPATLQAYLWQGFQNRSWFPVDGACATTTPGCPDLLAKSGNIRFAWMERQMAEIFINRGW